MWFIHNSNHFATRLQPLESYLFIHSMGPKISSDTIFFAIPKYLDVFVCKSTSNELSP
jgi:hypothetical protein